jgi:hypothetical protein
MQPPASSEAAITRNRLRGPIKSDAPGTARACAVGA